MKNGSYIKYLVDGPPFLMSPQDSNSVSEDRRGRSTQSKVLGASMRGGPPASNRRMASGRSPERAGASSSTGRNTSRRCTRLASSVPIVSQCVPITWGRVSTVDDVERFLHAVRGQRREGPPADARQMLRGGAGQSVSVELTGSTRRTRLTLWLRIVALRLQERRQLMGISLDRRRTSRRSCSTAGRSLHARSVPAVWLARRRHWAW